MPLSEHEQRLLEEIEQALEADDPRLASRARSSDLRAVARRRTRYAGAGLILGAALLVAGVVYPRMVGGIPILGVAGFCVMFAAAGYGWAQYKRFTGRADLRIAGEPPRRQPHPRSARPGDRGHREGSLVARMEARFLRRFDGR